MGVNEMVLMDRESLSALAQLGPKGVCPMRCGPTDSPGGRD